MKTLLALFCLLLTVNLWAQSLEKLIEDVSSINETSNNKQEQKLTEEIIAKEIADVDSESDNELSVKIYGGASGGVLYFNVPLDFNQWQLSAGEANPLYARGVKGSHYGVNLSSQKFGDLDYQQSFQNNAAYNSQTCNGMNPYHQTLTSFKYDAPNLELRDWGKIKWGLSAQATFLLNSNKYLEDHQQTGINTKNPVSDNLINVSPETYISAKHNFINSPQIQLAVNGEAAFAPMVVMVGTRKQAGIITGQDVFMGPQFTIKAGTLIKFKDKKGRDRVAIALNFSNIKTIPTEAGEKFNYNDRAIAGSVSYQITDQLQAGVYAQNNQRIVERGSTIDSKYFEVLNNFGFHLKYSIKSKNKKTKKI